MIAKEKGFFLQATTWELTDERTGELKQGVTVHLAKAADGTEYNPVHGVVMAKYTNMINAHVANSLFNEFKEVNPFQEIEVEVDLEKKGKRWKETLLGLVKDQKVQRAA